MFLNKIASSAGLLLLFLLTSIGADGATMMMMRNGNLAQSAGVSNQQRDSGLAFCDGKAREVQLGIRQLTSMGCPIDICARGSAAGNSFPLSNVPPPFSPAAAAAPCECPPPPMDSSSPVFFILSIIFLVGFVLSSAALAAFGYWHFKKN